MFYLSTNGLTSAGLRNFPELNTSIQLPA